LWKGRIVVAKRGELSAEKRKTDRWVGVPSMRAVAAHLSAGIGVHCNVAIASVRRENGRWILTDSSGNRHGPYDVVVVAVPPPRATALLKAIPALTDRLYDIRMQPCLAVMAAFDKPLDLPFDAAFIDESPLTWVARNNSKPGRAAAECWVFHAGARWSETHADMDDKSLVRLTTEAFSESIGCGRVDPIFGVTRYWDSAAAAHPLRAGCLWDACLRIGLCGDWCQLSRMEGAALSGMAMAGRILNMAAGSKKDLEAACT
jgi:hypothetical protein